MKSVVPPPTSHDQHGVAPASRARHVAVVIGEPGVERGLRLLEQRHARRDPASAAARTVSSRATSSNDAGTVQDDLLVGERAAGERACQAPREVAQVRAPTPRRARCVATSVGALAPRQDRRPADRRRGWQSHDLAEATRRPGTRAPCVRASSPTMTVAVGVGHGSVERCRPAARARRRGRGTTAASGAATRSPGADQLRDLVEDRCAPACTGVDVRAAPSWWCRGRCRRDSDAWRMRGQPCVADVVLELPAPAVARSTHHSSSVPTSVTCARASPARARPSSRGLGSSAVATGGSSSSSSRRASSTTVPT